MMRPIQETTLNAAIVVVSPPLLRPLFFWVIKKSSLRFSLSPSFRNIFIFLGFMSGAVAKVSQNLDRFVADAACFDDFTYSQMVLHTGTCGLLFLVFRYQK